MTKPLGKKKYTSSHEWVSVADDGTATVGISDFAQSNLGDIVYVELPEPGTEVAAQTEVALVESVKSASDIYSPVSGQIVEVNMGLVDDPDRINASAEEEGWLFRVQLSKVSELESLLDEEDYLAVCE